MEEFKVGDWVICNIEPFKINNINNGIINSHCEIKECILWQPKIGEYIWDKDYGMAIVLSCDIENDNMLAQEIFGDRSKFTLVLHECEPFIGELPTFLKDNK